MTRINGLDYVGMGFPTDEGKHLAAALLEDADVDWADLTIDLSECPSSLLISAFFNSFLQHVYEEREELLEQARSIRWELGFDFQRDCVAKWMRDFRPFSVR